MKQLLSGLTWNQVQNLFDIDQEYIMILELRPRRASLGVRKKNLIRKRKVWRFILQRDYKNYIKTIVRFNIKSEEEGLKETKLTDKELIKLNNLIN